jgi:hypothetical protein
MIFKNNCGVGLVEILLVIPLFTLLIAGTLITYKILDSKNMALNDAFQINLIANRQKKEIRSPLSGDLKRDNESINIRQKKGNRMFLKGFLHAPLSWKSEVELAFSPRKKGFYSGEQLEPGRFSEKNLLLIDSWDKRSNFGKKLKQSIDFTHAAILLTLLGR